jgi:hypothetical protein
VYQQGIHRTMAHKCNDPSKAGLPDGLFSNQKSQIGQIFEDFGLETADIFYGHLEYFTAIWDIL